MNKHSLYNRSEKGKARQARYRETHREQRRASQTTLASYIRRRRRTLAEQREQITNRLEELNASA